MYKLTTHLLVALPVDGRVKKREVNGGSTGNPNVERQVSRYCAILGKGRETGYPVACRSAESRSSRGAENKPGCMQGVSNVIYRNVYVVTLIIVSGILSNYILVIYQIAR
jgi:hypothetical protein